MILAALSDNLTQALTLIGATISILSFFGLLRYGSRFLNTQAVRSQLEEKDETIKTHEQNIDALEKRLSIFEDEIKALTTQVDHASTQIAHLESKLEASIESYKELEKYAAPSALDTLVKKFEQQEILLNKLLTDETP